MLSKRAINEFQEVYLKEYGETLTFDEGAARAESLLRLYKAVLKPAVHKGIIHESTRNSSTIT